MPLIAIRYDFTEKPVESLIYEYKYTAVYIDCCSRSKLRSIHYIKYNIRTHTSPSNSLDNNGNNKSILRGWHMRELEKTRINRADDVYIEVGGCARGEKKENGAPGMYKGRMRALLRLKE